MGTRADNHDGSCREILTGRLKGKWRVQVTVIEPTGRKRRLSRIFKSKTDAKTFLQAVRRGERIEAARQSRELTLAQWFAWLAENDWPENLAPFTVDSRKARFEKYVAKVLGDTPLSSLDPLRVRAFYQKLKSQGMSDALIVTIKGDLVRTYNQAISPYRRVPSSVANPFRLPVSQPQPREAVALTAEEVRQALARPALTQSQRAMLAVFLLAGLRLGEVMALTKGQLRFDDGLIVIDRAVRVAFGGKQTVGSPKGNKIRQAVMCRTLAAFLSPVVAELAPDDLVWSAATENQPRMKKLVYATWRVILNAAKLPTHMSPHDCRLTHINLIEKLMPLVSATTLKEHVGHTATGVTEANYTRPINSAQEILRGELDRVFGQLSGKKPGA